MKNKEMLIRWLVLIGLILIFLFFVLNPLFTGEVINETSNQTCYSIWQPCIANNTCCSGLSCQGGTCKTIIVSNVSTNQTVNSQTNLSSISKNISTNQSECNSLEQSCKSGFDCCNKLICLNGVCKENKITCVDSDGGKNNYLTGRTSGFNEEGKYELFLKDNCTISNLEVEEFYCENEIAYSEIVACPNGCEKGVCKCKSSEQSCSSNLECCSGFNCINQTCVSQGEQLPSSLKNKVLCTFIEYPCELDEDCCSKNCVSSWKFLFWNSEFKICDKVKLEK